MRDLKYPANKIARGQTEGADWTLQIAHHRDETLQEVFPQDSHLSPWNVNRCSFLLEPNVPKVYFIKSWKKNFPTFSHTGPNSATVTSFSSKNQGTTLPAEDIEKHTVILGECNGFCSNFRGCWHFHWNENKLHYWKTQMHSQERFQEVPHKRSCTIANL